MISILANSTQPIAGVRRKHSESNGHLSWPLVSVVIPIFNHEKFIIECLESIKRDRYKRIELIAIDDGSSDNSYNIALAWISDNNGRFESAKISKQQNSGITATLNRLVQQSSGEFIFPLASDDQVAIDGIFNLVHYYNDNFNEPTLLFSNVELIDPAGLLVAESAAIFQNRKESLLVSSRRFLSLDIVTCWGAPFQHQFYSRALFDSVGGYDERLKFEDLYFALKNVARGSVGYAPIKSRRYRTRPTQSLTPGLSISDMSQLPIRLATLRDFNIGYQTLIYLLCLNDRHESGLIHNITRVMLSIFRRSLNFSYSLKFHLQRRRN